MNKNAPDAFAPAFRGAPADRLRTVISGIGQTLITVGVIVLLFVVYEVYVTDLFGHEKQAAATSALDRTWKSASGAPSAAQTTAAQTTAAPRTGPSTLPGPASVAATKVVTVTDPVQLVTDPRTRKRTYQTFSGQGFAKIYIPSFGVDYVFTVIEGTSDDDLYQGPGHYDNTQYPGEQGNFSIAGHRVSKGSPFNELGLLSSCDALLIETENDWFVYRVLPLDNEAASWTPTTKGRCAGVNQQTGRYDGVFGREITDPSDYSQVLPVPTSPSTVVPPDAERLLTLTTCHPQFSAAQRMIIHGVLVKSYKKSAGFLPPELTEA